MHEVKLFEGDNRESLRRLIDQGVRVHSVVTDPPYGLVSVQKRFGKEGSAAARTEGNDGSFARLSGGFMGKVWDGTGIERDPEFWKLIYEILLPGGYVFAFSGSRTGHWQACAMEVAGFVMHPMHGWTFGSGFPKAHAADKAIDKHLGAVREVVGTRTKHTAVGGNDLMRNNGKRTGAANYSVSSGDERITYENVELDITAPATPEASQWEGWAYGTQAQKPALEPIYLGQKPFSEKTGAANLLKHGVGAVNVDGCRVPGIITTNPLSRGQGGISTVGHSGQEIAHSSTISHEGRHPSNLILDGSPEVVAMFPDSKSGAMKASTARSAQDEPGSVCYGTYGGQVASQDIAASSGSAARFFHQFPIDADPLFYHPKAGKLDRAGSKHPTVKPIALMQYLIRHITPPGGTVLDPFAGSGTTAEAARREGFDCILMEAEAEYIDFLRERFLLKRPMVNYSHDLSDLLS